MPAVAERERYEIVGSNAFNLEYQEGLHSESSIKEDIISYLGEYRFEIPKYEYSLFFSRNHSGTSIFTSDGETMLEKSRRAIAKKKLRQDPTHREENETLGLVNLESQLKQAKEGDTIFWGSPPGPEDEGYGNYGFIYKGRIQSGKILMAALRVDNPTIEQYNRAMTTLTGARFDLQHADDFLRSPRVVNREVSDSYIEHVLKQGFSYSPNPEKQKDFEGAIRILGPLIDRTIFAIQNGTREEKQRTFYALENSAIELCNSGHGTLLRGGLDYIILTRSFEPPVARGSCGSTASNMLFSGESSINGILMPDKYGDREFECPNCHQINVRPMDQLLEKCQHCGSSAVSCESDESS
ncbi:MAG: hypothetical protein A3C30_03915 [Candidatus Levybacteria bacterium RIFCSPHIGHO2_02_FULL_40_18]|nr:MAG: hypothetical protein A2869_00535 [Candidatus Levybacteria bacterium RIFCSPHIGHO2_01_FULL_40_58]OGH26231.1 MAG: hypothetical protein A3C30_03915 [Candidatus Levybacteria bacterium RIFCSPHIGHO2_02_FULL_40_18]OGH31483.1 MAG: hypothetical protein A3E43_02955 [Candidatus Levybacteria bacterium RIFCSPHIGHO2_12_FULL_40_31]OGH40123.1 MAG: hypothetical protein A2894_04275 [Candidatus Levybacteria bacterium RIFCSPLOWO2_01_FULL_40_64]OGH49076.1 MAG: hypothetical protein A3I54_00700 [Candidatus Lev